MIRSKESTLATFMYKHVILPCICPTCPKRERELIKSDVATSLTRLLLCIVLGCELLSSTACELLERDLVDL